MGKDKFASIATVHTYTYWLYWKTHDSVNNVCMKVTAVWFKPLTWHLILIHTVYRADGITITKTTGWQTHEGETLTFAPKSADLKRPLARLLTWTFSCLLLPHQHRSWPITATYWGNENVVYPNPLHSGLLPPHIHFSYFHKEELSVRVRQELNIRNTFHLFSLIQWFKIILNLGFHGTWWKVNTESDGQLSSTILTVCICILIDS